MKLIDWHQSEMGRWWNRQVERVSAIEESPVFFTHSEVRVATEQHKALNRYLKEVEAALEGTQ